MHSHTEVLAPEYFKADDEAPRKPDFLDVWGAAQMIAAAPRYAPRAVSELAAVAQTASEAKQALHSPMVELQILQWSVGVPSRCLGAEGEAMPLALCAAADGRAVRPGHVQRGWFKRCRQQLDASVKKGISCCLNFSLLATCLADRPQGVYRRAVAAASASLLVKKV